MAETSRIHWLRLKKALVRYGKDLEKIGKDTLTEQKHIDTGNLRKSIKSSVRENEDGARFQMMVEWTAKTPKGDNYGDYADRWYKKSGRRAKKRLRKNTRVRDIPTFIDEMTSHFVVFNSIIEDEVGKDLEETINDYIKDFNKNK
jgi:hypothetical protein